MGTRLRSPRPVERFTEMLRLLNESHLLLDPLYGMMRRSAVATLPRPVMLYEDQIFAARLALAGPFGHIGEVLSYRGVKAFRRPPAAARLLDVTPGRQRSRPRCSAGAAGCGPRGRSRPSERRQASAAVARMFPHWKRVTGAHRRRNVAGLVSQTVARPPSVPSPLPRGR